jgi:FkbM family methyltransferase
MRKLIKSSFGEWVDTEVWGLKLRLAPRGNLSEQRLLFTPETLDATERMVLAEELKDGGVFLDIGTNAGVYTLWMASRPGRRVRVESFEPDPELCRRLTENLARNGLANVHLHCFALGEEEGTAFLARGSGNLGENEVRRDAVEGGVEVALRRLPGVLEERGIGKVDALKIDVEGHEAGVMKPFFEEVDKDRWPRLIVCEVLEAVEDLEIGRLLLEHGYELAGRGRLNGIFRLR